MALANGTRLGVFEITGQIGVGGMGVVYRATDTDLKRDVAIKTLPESLAADPERMARFQREAEVLASLNHPNIAQIFGLERSDGATALVMEYVEGPTLADRIAEGPLPADEALDIAMQIAEALEAAHVRGIVHRDLKPANVKLRDDGTVKVLDFGIAKALDTRVITGPDTPALTTPAMTEAGIVMGTAAYMSPEQARGKPVDQRADIWSFGCVLYEMLTGQLMFGGEDVAVVLARVLERGADTGDLPESIAPAVRHTIELCLEKDPKRRIADIRDVRLALGGRFQAQTGAGAGETGSGRTSWRAALLAGTPALLIGVVITMFATGSFRPAPAGEVTRMAINLSLGESLAFSAMDLSPDGRSLAFTRRVGGGEGEICIRNLTSYAIRCLAGTERANSPFFSPDGQRIAYDVNGELWSVSINGELRNQLSPNVGVGATWASDDSIVMNRSYNEGLWLIPEPGATPVELTTIDAGSGVLGHFWPRMLPDGNTVLFSIFRPQLSEAEVAAYRLDTGEIVPLFSGALNARYVPTGHLLFLRENTLMAVAFDPVRLVASGAPTPVMDDIALSPGNGMTALAISDDGTVAYVPNSVGNPETGLVWLDREGNREILPGIRGPLAGFSLSPDGTRLAIGMNRVNPDVSVYELANGRGQRLTLKEGTQQNPVWSPDSSRIAYQSDEPPFDLFSTPANGSGSEELLISSPYDKNITSFSPDGDVIVFSENRQVETGNDIWMLSLDQGAEPVALVQTDYNEFNGRISPDGNWFAYQSNREGRAEIYIDSFPEPVGARRISTNGGTDPRWSRDGQTLYYRSNGFLIAQQIEPGPPLELLRQQQLFSLDELRDYDVAEDGRFLFIDVPTAIQPRQINIIQNWFVELEQRVPVN